MAFVKNTSDLLIFHFSFYLFEERIKLFLDIVKRVFSHVVRLTLLPFHLPLLGGQLWLECRRVCREAATLREGRQKVVDENKRTEYECAKAQGSQTFALLIVFQR